MNIPTTNARIKVDVSGWETGDWCDMLRQSIRMQVVDNEVTINFDFEDVVKQIAADAIHCFLNEGCNHTILTTDGLIFKAEETDDILLPFSSMALPIRGLCEAADAWRKFLVKEQAEWGADS